MGYLFLLMKNLFYLIVILARNLNNFQANSKDKNNNLFIDMNAIVFNQISLSLWHIGQRQKNLLYY